MKNRRHNKNNNLNDDDIFYSDEPNIRTVTRKTSKPKLILIITVSILATLLIGFLTFMKNSNLRDGSKVTNDISFNAIKDTTPFALGSLTDGRTLTAYELPEKAINPTDLAGYSNITNIYKDTILFYENETKDKNSNTFVGSLKSYNLKTKKAKTIFKEEAVYSNVQINDDYIICENNKTINIYNRKTDDSSQVELSEIIQVPNARAILLSNTSIVVVLNDSVVYYNIPNQKVEKEIKDVIFNGFVSEISNDDYALFHVTKSFKSEVNILDLKAGKNYNFKFEHSILIKSMIDHKDHIAVLTSNGNDFYFDKKTKKIAPLESAKVSDKIEIPDHALFTDYVVEKANLNSGKLKVQSLNNLEVTELDISKLIKDPLSSNLNFIGNSIILEFNNGEDFLKRYYIMVE